MREKMKQSKVSLAIFVFVFFFTGCESNPDKNIKKENYINTQWLGIEGEISKGYQPFLKVTYFAYSDKCKTRKNENIFSHTFMYIITRFIPVENALYRRSVQRKVYKADINEEGEFYSIKYPNDFEINNCKFEIAETLFNFKKYDINSKNNKSGNDQTSYGSVFKYFVLDSASNNLDTVNELGGNHYCKRLNEVQSNRNIICHEGGEKNQRDYLLKRNSYQNGLLEKKKITVNIFVLHDLEENKGAVDEAK